MDSHSPDSSEVPSSIQDTEALATFTRYLRLLHRLSTTTHAAVDDLFADYLQTGCEIFGARYGALSNVENGELRTRKLYGTATAQPEEHVAADLLRSRTTQICAGEHCSHAFYIGAPIILDENVYGTISFWSDPEAEQPVLHPQAREFIELMAQSVGVGIHQRRLTDQLAHQAMHDALTGLPNRLLLKERLDAILSKPAEEIQAAVVFIDLDRFKEINDSLGHGVGDEVLKQVARRLQASLQPTDTLARMGGDEFTAMLTGFDDRHDAVRRARNMLSAVRMPCRVASYELFVTGSIGVSFYPTDGVDAATLLRNADSAMYIAKARGKNDVHCFDAELNATALERLELETRLRRALERSEFDMLFQPQVRLDGALVAVEVLLVWEPSDLGRISPSRFIPIAEETGMIVGIGSWVLHEACRTMAEWLRRDIKGVAIAVNVSALQFAERAFVRTVADALAATGLPPASLELELTESLIMRDVEQSASIMRELRELGVRIAIDDFGTGYSSLSYLRRLPADSLKIDQSFLRGIESEDAAALVETIVTLGHALHLEVTAEGVETDAQMAVLRRAKCDRIQGHLIGAGMDGETLRLLLEGGWRWHPEPS